MKYIIIGMGNFGAALSSKLTAMGHEVIGVDSDMSRVESVKDQVTHVICLNSTDHSALNTLPLHDADVVVVAIGEDLGASIMTTANLKQLHVKRIISRALSPLHQGVLEAIGVKEIIHPEEESAERLAKTLDMRGILDSFDLFGRHNVVEIELPERYIGKNISESDIRTKYQLNVLTIVRQIESKNIFGVTHKKPVVLDYINAQTIFQEGDLVVVFGKKSDIKNFISSKDKDH